MWWWWWEYFKDAGDYDDDSDDGDDVGDDVGDDGGDDGGDGGGDGEWNRGRLSSWSWFWGAAMPGEKNASQKVLPVR